MHREYSQHPIEYTHFRTPHHSRARWVVLVAMMALFAGIVYLFSLTQAPRNFVADTVVTIEQGMTVRSAAQLLEKENIIRSAKFFEVLMHISEHPVIAGDYLFEDPQTILEIAERIVVGQYGDVRVKIVIHEGWSNVKIADLLEKKLPVFERDVFLNEAETLEGYLYPDTYFFFPSVSTTQVIDTLHQSFLEAVHDLSDDFRESEYSIEDIIIMASIIEKEATTDPQERAIISGILWNRIAKGMPLQVDAPFVYALGKGSHDLTIADLRKDSPYNTYTNKGLTPTPIGNPSVGSIVAALNPTQTSYLFYLHGSDRQVHYAVTHDGHVSNKRKYLD